MPITAPISLTQSVRDEIISDIKALNIPGLNPACVKKQGVLYGKDGDAQVIVIVEDEPVAEDVANNLRMLFCTIRLCVFVAKDRDGTLLDSISSYLESYAREPREFGAYDGFTNARTEQICGASSRMDMLGEDAWFVNTYTMILPYGRQTTRLAAPVPPVSI